jgi:hypothetical protein
VTVSGSSLVYEPAVIGFASVRFSDRKLGVDAEQDVTLLLPLSERGTMVSWKDAAEVKLDPRDLEEEPAEAAAFSGDLPEAVSSVRGIQALGRDLADHLYRTGSFGLAYNPTLKLYARSAESERDFKVHCQQVAREQRDAAVDKLRDKYEDKVRRLQERLEREQQELAEDKAAYKGRMAEEVLSGLATVAGAIGVLGRRSGSLRSLSTAATKRRMTSSAKADIAESEAAVARLQADMETLKSDMEQEADQLTQQWAAAADDIQQTRIVPKKADIAVQMVALAWAPSWQVTYEDARGRSRTEAAPAYTAAASS